MATAREIHRHMKGIKNIGQITKAMKMVAAARLRKAQEKAGSSRPYALKIKERQKFSPLPVVILW